MRPDFPSTAAVEIDLRNLVNAQESYFAEHVGYSESLDQLNFHPSAGVSVTIQNATAGTWSATATHAQAPDWMCGIFVGGLAPHAPGQKQAEPIWWHR